ncbi:hypothetical protein JCM8547_006627 [Rhodosporidiobolus lusitaniae]
MSSSSTTNAGGLEREEGNTSNGEASAASDAAVSFSRFPNEIYTFILSNLNEWADLPTLAACCLVSRSFRSICRPLLYRNVAVDTLGQPQNAHLATLVRSLGVRVDVCSDLKDTDVQNKWREYLSFQPIEKTGRSSHRDDGFWDAFSEKADMDCGDLVLVVELLEKLPELERFEVRGSELKTVTKLWDALSRLPKVEEVLLGRALFWERLSRVLNDMSAFPKLRRVEANEAFKVFDWDEDDKWNLREACKRRGNRACAGWGELRCR